MGAFAGGNGYETDADTGLIRCGNRYYNPYFGRFITQDPVGSGNNWYVYCANDPTRHVDPSGCSYQHPSSPDLVGNNGDLTAWAEGEIASMNAQADSLIYGLRVGNVLSHAVIKGNPDFVADVKHLLIIIAASPIGGALLFSISTTGNPLNIHYWITAPTATSEEQSSHTDVINHIIYFDPTIVELVLTTAGRELSSHAEQLEHEIGHDATWLNDMVTPNL